MASFCSYFIHLIISQTVSICPVLDLSCIFIFFPDMALLKLVLDFPIMIVTFRAWAGSEVMAMLPNCL